MNAIKFEKTIDETVAGAMPELRPLLGRRVEVIALDAVPDPVERRQISFDDFLAHRLKRPADVEPVTLEDMERAIARGALGEGL
jgi:hypothetical protein